MHVDVVEDVGAHRYPLVFVLCATFRERARGNETDWYGSSLMQRQWGRKKEKLARSLGACVLLLVLDGSLPFAE